MISMQRVFKLCTLSVIGVAASGCIVLPYGAGHGRYERGGHHERGGHYYSQPHGDSRSYPDQGATPVYPYRRGR